MATEPTILEDFLQVRAQTEDAMHRILLLLIVLITTPISAMETGAGRLSVSRMASGLEEPWSIAFLPNGQFLISEREGTLKLFLPNAESNTVAGLPKVVAEGQGGLMDILVPRDFQDTREIYLTFAKKQGKGAGTALGRGRLSNDGTRLEGFETIFEMTAGSRGGRHFGGRLVEARDGNIFMTIGERGDRPSAQDLTRHNGSVLRLTRSGLAAAGNPFTGQKDLQNEIWSFGHRNPQGSTLDLHGNLIISEHGARGGDEVNLITKGSNYGWPVVAYGRHYTGGKIGEGNAKAGMKQPAHYWDPSIAPSGTMVYSGKLWPEWRGDIFVGSLKSDYISRLSGDGDIREVEQLKSRETKRVRDVREAPDGSIWFLSVDRHAAFRIGK